MTDFSNEGLFKKPTDLTDSNDSKEPTDQIPDIEEFFSFEDDDFEAEKKADKASENQIPDVEEFFSITDETSETILDDINIKVNDELNSEVLKSEPSENVSDDSEIENTINNEIFGNGNNFSGNSKISKFKGVAENNRFDELKDHYIKKWSESTWLGKIILVAPFVALLLFLFDVGGMKLGFISLISATILAVLFIFKSDDISSPLWAVPNSLLSVGVILGAIISKQSIIVILFGIFLLTLSVIQWLVVLEKINNKQLLRTIFLYFLAFDTVFALIILFSGFSLGLGVFIFGLASIFYLFSQTVLFVLNLQVEESNLTHIIYSVRQYKEYKEALNKDAEEKRKIRFEEEQASFEIEKKRRLEETEKK